MPEARNADDRNYYELLGLDRAATTKEIRQAYHDIARVFHPDSNFYDEIIEVTLSPEHEHLFKLITSAYDTLVNPDSRSRYDSELESGTAVDLDMSQFKSEVWRNWDKPSGYDKTREKRPRQSTKTWGSFGVIREELQRAENAGSQYQQAVFQKPVVAQAQSVEEIINIKRQAVWSRFKMVFYFGFSVIAGIAGVFLMLKG